MLNSTEDEISTAHNTKYKQVKKCVAFSLNVVFIMLICVKMPKIYSRINFVLTELCMLFYNLWPALRPPNQDYCKTRKKTKYFITHRTP